MVTRSERQQLVRAAQRLLGTGYDHSHGDDGWRNLHRKPTSFDCSTFVCRVAMEVLGYWPGHLAADAAWLLDHLVEVASRNPATSSATAELRPTVNARREMSSGT